MVAALLVNLMTLAGVCLAAPGIQRLHAKHSDVDEGMFSAFAAGALFACAFFLLLFESTHLIGVNHTDSEVDVLWRWDTMILAGFISASCRRVVEHLGPRRHHPINHGCNCRGWHDFGREAGAGIQFQQGSRDQCGAAWRLHS